MKKLVLLLILIFPVFVLASTAGDIDGDGKIKSSDYILLRKYLLKSANLNETQKTNADVNGDGKVNSQDYILIRKVILGEGTISSTPKPTIVPTTAPTVAPTPTSVPANNTPLPQSIQPGFKLFTSYDSETLKYWSEFSASAYNTHGSDYMFLTHIWVKNPGKQIKIALGGGTTFGNNTPEKLIKEEIKRLGLNNKGLVTVNSSFFGDSNYSSWGTYQSTPVIIHEGKILRDDSSKSFPSGTNAYSAYGITKDGTIKFYEMDADHRISSRDQMIADEVQYSGAAYGEIKLKNPDSTEFSRTMICTMDRNNFILISAHNMTFDNAGNLAYNILGCNNLINIDGGGSLTLLFKDKSNLNYSYFCTTRSLSDMLYFVEQ